MEEERRQQQDGDDVAPVEDPIELVEAAAEREREDAEEDDRQPEEVQRRGVARPAPASRKYKAPLPLGTGASLTSTTSRVPSLRSV
jgi:hypothetical protein